MTDVWLHHISTVLTRKGVIAYMWDSAKDSFRWTGDVHGVLGLEEKDYPAGNAQFSLLINPQELPQRMAALHAAKAGVPFQSKYKLRHAGGAQIEVEENAAFHTDEETGAQILTGTIEMKPRKEKENIPVMHEPGTAHTGRRALLMQIERWASQPEDRRNALGYLLAAGIDRLSLMNESFGALYVDELIEKTGDRLRDIVGDAAHVARINGDVFGIFFSRGPHNEMAAVARYILNNLYELPLITTQGPMSVGVTIGGVPVTARECRDIASLLTKAEMALQVAKERGRGGFVSYSEAADQAASNRMMLESGNEFLLALKTDRVRLAFQPVVNFSKQEVSFHECLIRMIGEDGKMHSAAEFIPAIEHLGLGRLVDQYAMNKAIHELNQFPDLVLSVNVSYMTLTSREWLRGLVAVLRDRPSLARRLIVEITEGMVIKDTVRTVQVVQTLKEMGCRVALDDFGAGFTAFSQMKDMDLDIVKIDKSFIRNIKDKRSHLFVKALQTLADGVNVQTVGEGVETLEDARLLANEGVKHIQGYAFGFPCVERIWLPKGHSFRQFEDAPLEGRIVSRQKSLEETLLSGVN